MRPTPPDLAELRSAVRQSAGWYRARRRVTEAERAELSDSARAECRWGSDPELLAQLQDAERAWTRTFGPA